MGVGLNATPSDKSFLAGIPDALITAGIYTPEGTLVKDAGYVVKDVAVFTMSSAVAASAGYLVDRGFLDPLQGNEYFDSFSRSLGAFHDKLRSTIREDFQIGYGYAAALTAGAFGAMAADYLWRD